MKRTMNVDMKTRCKSAKTALRRFLKRYPEVEHWIDELEFMFDNGIENETNMNTDAKENLFSIWAERLDYDLYYMAVIEEVR